MVNTSKILTVSYGTFSCTLEGFDDSFETMKAIAEYFRDLASDDRYFGAEPPTPDAEMLARIAEREIERRVEAHQEQGKIVLRAGETPALATAAVAEAVPVAKELPEAEAPIAEEPAVEAPSEDTAKKEPAIAVSEDESTDDTTVEAEPAQQYVEDTVADVAPADLAPEIETAADAESGTEPATDPTAYFSAAEDAPAAQDAYVAEATDEPSVEIADEDISGGDAPIQPAATEDETPAGMEADADPAMPEETAASDEEDGEHIETAEEFFQNSPEPDAPVYYESESADMPADDPGSVAAKLSAIRSVVSQNEQPYETEDYSEDEHAQDFLSETAADLGAALAVDDAAELEAAEDEQADTSDTEQFVALAEQRVQELEDDEVADADGEIADTDDLDAMAQDSVEGEDAPGTDDAFEDTLSQLLADSIVSEDVEFDVELPEAFADSHDNNEAAESSFEEESSDVEASDEDLSDEVAAELTSDEVEGDDAEAQAPVNARVIKMTSDEFEAALADDAPAQDDTETAEDTSDAVAEDADALLSPEQEEELQRELAEVEADLIADDAEELADESLDAGDTENSAETDEDTAEAEDQDVAAAPREGRHKFEATDGSSDIERIFDEADSQLEQPESNQRRSAIQHLRAAVAATRAEKKAGADLQKNVDDAPYRSDLASVVRPRRPSTTDGARSERPSESRPAPLKLVAEQRVDTERAPIRPRRVSAAEATSETDTSSEETSNFSEYARQMGAQQLPDLLEAAAAYMSDVEGRAQFSRPMLMHKLQEVEKENFSREDGLRSFGKLLREGKIQKIKGGRFTVTDETEFRDDARHAG